MLDSRSEPADEVAALIARYAVNVSATLAPRIERAAKAALIDSIAVAMGALAHPAAQAARRHAYRFPVGADGCLLWGSERRTTPDIAALTNGVLLRCYDYNDFFVGARNSGHASDMASGVIAAAEWANAPGAKLLSALAVGYEVVGAAYDAFSTAPGGWDYTNLTAIGATCAIARVLDLDTQQVQEALAMTVVPHFASDEIESGDLNARGDLTMWKRFNGSDAVRNSLQACLLASAGVEGAVRPFVGKHGFIRKLAHKSEDVIPVLRERLAAGRPLSRIADAYFKRWPVGSLAQSAIQAALAARAKLGDVAAIRQVRVYAEEGAYDHLVTIRKDPWHPISRETADHSLPYIVAAAVLDGHVRTESFAPTRVLDPTRQRFLEDKVVVLPAPDLGTLAGGKLKRAQAGYLSRVEIETADGEIVHGDAAPSPGHPRNPFTDADLAEKLRENVAPFAGAAHTENLTQFLFAIERARSTRELTALLALPDNSGIDAMIAP
ncbi:MAG: 2-methylcitrate dehydratase [Alphaproteobacteria bacterium]|jgi:2-methylcitrate dehydratase|nr:2-methylcitrate dehydratase [Alphaproteobacteria bacterium]